MGALVAVARLTHRVYVGRTGIRTGIRTGPTHSLPAAYSIEATIRYCDSGFGFGLVISIEDAGETEIERLGFRFLLGLEGREWEWKEQALR